MTSITDELANKQKLWELVERYTYVINHRYWSQLPNLFAQQATWRAIHPIDLEYKGLQEILSRIPQNVEKLDFLFQTSSEILVNLNTPERGTVHSQLNEVGRFAETGKGMYAIGAYEDVVIIEDNEWKFLERTFVLRYIDNDYAFKGEIIVK